MIKNDEIKKMAEEFKLSPHDLQRDYVHGLLLYGISQRPYLKDFLLLKGGNALRKAYIPSTRFSKDLDFSMRGSAVWDLLEDELKKASKIASEVSGVKFSNTVMLKRKKFEIPSISALEARLYFETFYGTEEVDLKVQLDMTESDKVILPVQEVKMVNPYSDFDSYPTLIRAQKIEEILASKLNAILYRPRRKCADLFDIFYAILVQSEYPVSKLEVISTFLRKSIFRRHYVAAEQALLAIPVQEFGSDWSSMSIPATISLDFDTISEKFSYLITSLCSLVSKTMFSSIDKFLSPEDRGAIMQAITSNKLINMKYDGFDRVIEPYELQYYVRKSDDTGHEYFWGYDNSGGKSGRIGIKQFFTHKIESYSVTDTPFAPRFIDGVPV
jgi:predicted nucleotidyltransferase component of viral defense system